MIFLLTYGLGPRSDISGLDVAATVQLDAALDIEVADTSVGVNVAVSDVDASAEVAETTAAVVVRQIESAAETCKV